MLFFCGSADLPLAAAYGRGHVRRSGSHRVVPSARGRFHEVLAEQSLDALLVRVANTVGELIPHDTLTIYEADEANGMLKPALVVRDEYVDEIISQTVSFTDGQGITGWAVSHREAVLANQALLDPHVAQVPGTPVEPESFICVPLIARGHVKGALNIYRDGEDVDFSETEFELAKRFGDAAALALDNAEIRERLEHQAHTDALTGLLNHSVFYEQLLHALQESSRVHAPVAVLMLDIDDFKHVNDVHGHAVGDELSASSPRCYGRASGPTTRSAGSAAKSLPS